MSGGALKTLAEAWDNLTIDVRLHSPDERFAVRVECFKPSYQQRFYGESIDAALAAAVDWVANNPQERTYVIAGGQ